MAKVRYSAGLKATAVVAQQIFSVVLVLCMIVLAVLFQKDILDFGNMKDKSFEGSGYFSAKFQEAADEVLNFTDLRKKFETDGSYDSEKEVDIWTTPTGHPMYNRAQLLLFSGDPLWQPPGYCGIPRYPLLFHYHSCRPFQTSCANR